ncbi:MAG TPA: glucose-6-phosphate dehydrogenase, partial [Nitrospirota bacterium]|nr:glucose-6-phosphate dehydrogenase [Nitrospirota bacterium]
MAPLDDPADVTSDDITTPARTARREEKCATDVPSPSAVIIFGASGDLTRRKILPSLYRLYKNKMLADRFFILGTSRVEMKTEQFRSAMLDAVKAAFPVGFDQETWNSFASRLHYSTFDYNDLKSYTVSLRNILPELEKRHQTGGNRIFYLAIPPTVFKDVINNLGASGLSLEDHGRSHIVIEKPFGRDLASARQLNNLVHTYYKESQIFRIDHYLAKETVQNILMFRFANSIFEPLWNRRYIDHIQITAAETLGVEHRASYYEEAGVLRDMFQNHMSELLALTAMEPPAGFTTDMVQDEKVKVFRAIRHLPLGALDQYLAVGQYTEGAIENVRVPSYRDEPGVAAQSATPTFAAMKLFVDNWRWHDVPFYLRSGKRLGRRMTEISVHFNRVPHSMFPATVGGPIDPNVLVLRVQPDEGMSLHIQTKEPGSKVCLSPMVMNYSYPRDVLLDAYEWVLLDCMLGDHMLFTREDSV